MSGLTAAFGETTSSEEKKCDLQMQKSAISLLKENEFCLSTWKASDIPQKKEILSSMIDKLNTILGTAVSNNIGYCYRVSNEWGAYNKRTNTIEINEYQFLKSSSYRLTQTLIHEMRHAYQKFAVDNPDKVNISSKTIEAWKENMKPENYKSPSRGNTYEEYLAQPVEWDAKNFAMQLSDLHGINPEYKGSWDIL